MGKFATLPAAFTQSLTRSASSSNLELQALQLQVNRLKRERDVAVAALKGITRTVTTDGILPLDLKQLITDLMKPFPLTERMHSFTATIRFMTGEDALEWAIGLESDKVGNNFDVDITTSCSEKGSAVHVSLISKEEVSVARFISEIPSLTITNEGEPLSVTSFNVIAETRLE